MIQRSAKYLRDGRPTAAMVASAIQEFEKGARPRIEKDLAYYRGDHGILGKTGRSNEPNNRLVHPFPRYIATMSAGYLIGKPIKYTGREQDQAGIEALGEVYRQADMDSEDAEMARDAAVTGRGVELLYTDEKSALRAAALAPEGAFVVYDSTVTHKKLFGVHYYPVTDPEGKITGERVVCYTDKQILYWEAAKAVQINGDPAAEELHPFQGVPMVEFWNDEDECGDFESVLTLIDAYNTLESERVNDKERYADSIMFLKGCTMEPDRDGEGKIIRTVAEKIRQDRMVQLPGDVGESDIGYLSRTMDESQTDVLRKSLENDIHKLSLVPDMSDERFSGNTSGVAMRYKLLGFEQLMRIKERWFKQALRERLELAAGVMRTKKEPAPDPMETNIIMQRSLPENYVELAQVVRDLDDIVSAPTLMTLLPFVEDPAAEIDKLKAEQAERDTRKAAAFGEPYALGRQQASQGAGPDDAP